MPGSRPGASDGRSSERSIEEEANAHTLPMVCDMLG